jgi:iron(III) transport system substrate-binding protein
LTRNRALVVPLVAALAAVFGSAALASQAQRAATPKPASAKAWKALVAKAKQEGSVTLYSSQDPTTLATFAAKFKERYGITVTWSRQIDSVLAAQVTAEEGTGNAKADMWVIASRPYVLGALRNGWAVNAIGPDLFNKRYDRAKFAKPGKAFAVGAAVQGIAWNTKLFSGRLRDYPDLLNPALAGGKIGVIQPTGPSLVDFYQMLDAHYGKDYVPKLAAQKPKIYLSTLPQLQAVASGELTAAALVGAAAIDLKAQGAPIEFVLPTKGAWNAPWFAMVLKQAPHPAAAQLLANYMVTPEGQQAVNRRYGSVLKNIPDTFYVPLRAQKLSDLTSAKITAYQQYWSGLFK